MPEQPSDLVTVFTGANQMEADAIVALLTAEEIPAFSFSIADQIFGVTPIHGRGCEVRVARVDHDRARAAIHSTRQDSVDLDWDEVDLGEPADDSVRDHLETKKSKGPFRSKTLRKTGFAAIFGAIGGFFGG